MKKSKIDTENTAKPFVKWVGGKTQLITAIEQTLPTNFAQISNVTYIEPFVGGGAVFFWILQKYPNIKKAVINDINPNLTPDLTNPEDNFFDDLYNNLSFRIYC